MAGKKQHHIWQMIQRGFGTKKGKDHEIWVYSKDRHPRKTVTRNFGYIKNYLSENGDSSADDVLTQFEQNTQSGLQKTKQAPDGTLLDSNYIAPIIAHLEMRSLFLRDELSRMGENFYNELALQLSSPEQGKKFLQSALRDNPTMISGKLDQMNLTEADRRLAEITVDHFLPNFLDQAAKQAPNFASTIQTYARENMVETVKSAHIESILSGFTEIERTQSHMSRRYFLRKSHLPIILPDTGVVFLKHKGATPLSQKGDRINDVLIPLDAHTYIHGYKSATSMKSYGTIIRLLSSCSYQNFIAREPNEFLAKASKKIGKHAKLLTEHEMKKIVRECFQTAHKN